ncbi:MoaF-related domain-containing protein [Achromobacter xylosoxidans]
MFNANPVTSSKFPAIGRKVQVRFGELAFELNFKDATSMTFTGLDGPFKGVQDTVRYTALEVASNIYMVYWHEPSTGANVVHVQDYDLGVVYTNIAGADGSFTNLKGVITLG